MVVLGSNDDDEVKVAIGRLTCQIVESGMQIRFRCSSVGWKQQLFVVAAIKTLQYY